MKFIIAIWVLFFFASINSSCKKTDTVVRTDTVTIRDTLRDTLRDTTYIQLIRTEIYRGFSTFTYPRSPWQETLSAIAWVRFYANDSTNYLLASSNRPELRFSIVSGHFWYPESPMSVTSTFVAPDSLYITGESGSFPSVYSVVFSGKKY